MATPASPDQHKPDLLGLPTGLPERGFIYRPTSARGGSWEHPALNLVQLHTTPKCGDTAGRSVTATADCFCAYSGDNLPLSYCRAQEQMSPEAPDNHFLTTVGKRIQQWMF